MTRPFRFGVVAPLRTHLPTWRARVRRIAEAGYSTLLMPDVPQWQPAPGPRWPSPRPLPTSAWAPRCMPPPYARPG